MRVNPAVYQLYQLTRGASAAALTCTGTIGTIYGLSETFRGYFDADYIYFIIAIFSVSASVFAAKYFGVNIEKRRSAEEDGIVLKGRIRFAVAADAGRIREIALEAFKDPALLFPPKVLKDLINRRIFRVLELMYADENIYKIVGYYAVLPIELSVYKMLRKHDIPEHKIAGDYVTNYMDPRCGALYILDVVVSANNGSYLKKALRDLVRYIAKMCRENNAIEYIGTWAFNEKGAHMGKMYHMKQLHEVVDFRGTYFYETRPDMIQKSPEIAGILLNDFQEVNNFD